jgi:hypothetical protein
MIHHAFISLASALSTSGMMPCDLERIEGKPMAKNQHTDDALQVFELLTIKPGGGAKLAFYVDKVEAEMAAKMAADDGYATRLQPIRLPTTPRQLADLLDAYATRFTLRG